MNESIVKSENAQLQSALSVENVLEQVNAIQNLMKKAMRKDEHFGIIPGCQKPSLLKPGAEKIMMMFRLAPSYQPEGGKEGIEKREFEGGHLEYIITTTLIHIPTGTIWGQGVGSCSTMESKFRFRWDNTGRQVPKEYWETRDKALLGGEQFFVRKTDKKWGIYLRVEHDNPADYYNVVLKMAAKRSMVSAVLNAVSCSDIFTQDMEDVSENEKVYAATVENEEYQEQEGTSDDQPTNEEAKQLYDYLEGNVVELEKVTSFKGKDGKMVPGVRNWADLKSTRANGALARLKREQKQEPTVIE